MIAYAEQAASNSVTAWYPTTPLLDPFAQPRGASLQTAPIPLWPPSREAKKQVREEGPPATSDEWLMSALSTLLHIQRLPVGWDGRHSPALRLDAFQAAAKVLVRVCGQRVALPAIGPVPGGGLQLEWHIGNRELEIEILPDGSLEFLTAEGVQEEEGSLSLSDRKVVELVRWVAHK
jgi:hypothetical protein